MTTDKYEAEAEEHWQGTFVETHGLLDQHGNGVVTMANINGVYKITVEANGQELKRVIDAFKHAVSDLEKSNYRPGFDEAVGCGVDGGNSVSYKAKVTCPEQTPLSDVEIHNLRKLLYGEKS